MIPFDINAENETLKLITKTPLMHLDKLITGGSKIYGKLEFLQPGGSVKDRAALQIINDAYANGSLKKGQVVVEMTSGNMGAGLAVVCKQFGNPFIAVISMGNSIERLKILKAFGAEIVVTEQVDGTPGMVTGKDIEYASFVAKQMAIERGGFYVNQFHNPSSVTAHFNTTGPELIKDLPDIDVFISSIGTAGTFTGTSKYLKSINKNIICVSVEPHNASILKTGTVSNTKHIIQGTGYGIIPPHWDPEVVDDIITVTDEEADAMTKKIALEQSLYVGYSSGANVAAAVKYINLVKRDVKIATILCDTGYKYTDL